MEHHRKLAILVSGGPAPGINAVIGAATIRTIGGDDTAVSAMKLEQKAAGRIRVVHVPKTIDNDLDLPPYVNTFGYQTARHCGVIVKNLMVDAKTASRWYFVITMGRKAGHLALGIGKAAGATLTLITEEFPRRPIRLKEIVDTLVGAIVKRLSYGLIAGEPPPFDVDVHGEREHPAPPAAPTKS